MDDGLQRLLIAAGEAPPDRRIEYRDPIAAYGGRAIDEMIQWAKDPGYVAFAIRVIGRAAEHGAMNEGLAALRQIAKASPQAVISGDVEAELRRLGAAKAPAPRKHRSPGSPRTPIATLGPDDLIQGRVYRRGADLHDHGLGGNRQKGISYPARGDYVFLFSGPEAHREYGYKDTWQGPDDYRYFGEWNGRLEMTLEAGNQAIIDRSPNIHLFVKSPTEYRYEGRFAYVGHDREWTERDGRSQQALVFSLHRVSDAETTTGTSSRLP